MSDKKFILLTGSTSGIGQHISSRLSERHNLILNGRNRDKLNDTLAMCANQENHLQWVYDLKDVTGIEQSLKAFIDEHKVSVSHFIHCAGYLKMLPLRSISSESIEETMHVNFTSAVFIIKTLISKKANGSAFENIVFISSTASIMGAKAFNVYSASKGALDSLMRSLAVELAPRIRANSILPGAIKTKMTGNIYENEELLKNMMNEYPLGLGEPDDIFEMVDFLISDKSKWITGQQFVVDGGRSINITSQS
jgi:NAD(P)-dependent dehydrogenase (short-subunit alcohol dehydrogenase family)